MTLSKPGNSVAQVEPILGQMRRSCLVAKGIEDSASPIAFGNQTISRNVEGKVKKDSHSGDSRLCVPTSQQVCLYRVQSSLEKIIAIESNDSFLTSIKQHLAGAVNVNHFWIEFDDEEVQTSEETGRNGPFGGQKVWSFALVLVIIEDRHDTFI